MKNIGANGISNMDIAVFALYLLGGVGRAIHLEKIAVKCHEMAAGRFAFDLSEYKKFPDKLAVFYALDTVRKERAGALVEGESQKFQITERGVAWIKANESKIAHALKIRSLVEPKREVERIRRAMKNDVVFRKYRSDGVERLSVYDFVDFLGCSFETSPSAVREKFADMKAKAALVEDAEISAFLRACEGRFAKLLNTTKETA